jgi:hypothetical protein
VVCAVEVCHPVTVEKHVAAHRKVAWPSASQLHIDCVGGPAFLVSGPREPSGMSTTLWHGTCFG